MVRAIRMSKEQIAELVDLARKDARLWEKLRDFEVTEAGGTRSSKFSELFELIKGLVDNKYSKDHNFSIGPLIIQLRYHARLELGLPVE